MVTLVKITYFLPSDPDMILREEFVTRSNEVEIATCCLEFVDGNSALKESCDISTAEVINSRPVWDGTHC